MSYKTRQQEAVREVLAAADRPLTPVQIQKAASDQAASIGLATVYRCLNRLIESGEARLVAVPGVTPHYEALREGHHHFFACKGCGRLFDLHGCTGGIRDLVPTGFVMESHEIIIYGQCPQCLSAS